jgi:hypothetical protein
MKRPVTILALCAIVALVAVLPAAASSRNPFRGDWKGIDAFDGSNVRLQIVEQSRSGGQVFHLRARDDRTGPWCGPAAEMTGVAVLEGDNVLTASMVWWCLPEGSNILYFLPDTLIYDPSFDKITGADGTIYTRAR